MPIRQTVKAAHAQILDKLSHPLKLLHPPVRQENEDASFPFSASSQALAERGRIHAAFEEAARSGFIPADALIVKLHTNHLDALAAEQRQLDQLEQELEAHLRRLDSLFPAPTPPVPEPPVPPRAQRFGPIRDMWGSGVNARH